MIRKKPTVTGDVDKAIGQRMRQLRMQLGMSQQALGAEVGLSFQQIQKYEKGTNRISVSRMLEFCEHLQTTPNDIIGWKMIGAGTPLNNLNSNVFAAARDFSQMSEDMQIALRMLCAAMIVWKKKR
jgi:transcriptional regulator with XRE-family HTH domain